MFHRARQYSGPGGCANFLRQIGTAYTIWANDHHDLFPASVASSEGGCKDVISGPLCWTNYATLANELGQWTRPVVCPYDSRKPATNFAQFTNNLSLSYFVGVNANETNPQSILGGDRNLAPDAIPQENYGYSPDNGEGNDVILRGAICWSLKMHSAHGIDSGNILLADGSVQHITSRDLRWNWLPPVSTSGPVRLIFP